MNNMKKIWTVEEIKEKIKNSDEMVKRSLLKLYEYQTDGEQETGETKFENGVGFNGADSNILSSIAKWVISGKIMTVKQTELVRKKLLKYAKQLMNIANESTMVKTEKEWDGDMTETLRATEEYEKAISEMTELTMSCNLEEAINSMKLFIKTARRDNDTISYIAALDLHTQLTAGKVSV